MVVALIVDGVDVRGMEWSSMNKRAGARMMFACRGRVEGGRALTLSHRCKLGGLGMSEDYSLAKNV